METMTPRERMIVAMTNGTPDRVPVAPDISNMIPARRTGKPFWEIYFFNEPPLWQAYIDAVKHFGFDGWFIYGDMQFQWPGERHEAIEDMRKSEDLWVVHYRGRIDQYRYRYENTYYIADPPTTTEKMLKDIEADWGLIEKLFAPPVGYNPSLLRTQRAALGELGAFGLGLGYPGLQHWFGLFDGGLEALTYWYYDKHELIEQLLHLQERQAVAQMEMILNERPDFVLLGASGTITMQSPKMAREFGLPTIKKLTAMAREAGVPTMLHSCGKERILVQWCAEETDLGCINPLEIAPMGDCDLADLKQHFGAKIALMGNLHTSEVMLMGSPEDVKREALKAILAAGQNGGFILSTGDQCGRDTPDENIFTLVRTARQFGQYPLDVECIKAELARMGTPMQTATSPG
jgi:uroporphyrinogen decarboxylase